MPTVRKVQLDRPVGEVLKEIEEDSASEVLSRIHQLMSETANKLHDEMAALGAEVEDGHGRKIPEATTDRDKIMFKAGEVSLALFIMGATLKWRKS